MTPNKGGLRKLHTALLAAYPERDKLAQMLFYRLDQPLNEIASEGRNLDATVFDLIQWASSNGKTLALFHAARAEKPGSPALEAIAVEEFGIEAAAPGGEPETHLERYLRAVARDLEFVSGAFGQDHRLIDVFVAPRLRSRPLQKSVEWPNLDWQRPIALIGTAGAGKSTLLRHLAYTTARACQEAGADLKKLRDASLRVPFLIDLHEVSDYDAERMGNLDFASLLQNRELSSDAVSRILNDGDAILLFDKFDEVADEPARVRLAQQIRRLQGGGKRPNGIVLASRLRIWTTDVSSGFVQIAVQPLEPDQIEQIVDKSFVDTPESSARILNALRSSARLRLIAANPQLLSMLMVVLQEDTGRDLSHRVLVYEACIQRLIREASRYVTWAPDDIMRMLTALAMAMRRENEPKLDLPGAARALQDFQEYGTTAHTLERLELSTGLIVGDARHRIVFVHQTFQEYLVARDYAATDDGLKQLLHNVEDPTWSETLALAAGVLADQRPERLAAFFDDMLAVPVSSPGEALAPDELAAWAPRVAAASVCFADLKAWNLGGDALEPVRRAHKLILPMFDSDRIDVRRKVDIAVGLGAFEDPRLQKDRWVRLEQADSFIGSDAEDAWPQEKPAHRVTVGAVWMQRWPVTVGEYRRFVANDGYTTEHWWDAEGLAWLAVQDKPVRPAHWEQQEVTNRPVTGISYWEARAYCRWLASLGGIPAGWTVRLPTEAEWERAARGRRQLADPSPRFPWGPDWNPLRASSAETDLGLVPVGVFATDAGDLWDMAGNVIERCLDRFRLYDGTDTTVVRTVDHVVRGGGYQSGPLDLRVSVRNAAKPDLRRPDIGFRCAAGPPLDQEGD